MFTSNSSRVRAAWLQFFLAVLLMIPWGCATTLTEKADLLLGKIAIDGRLDDYGWQRARRIGPFEVRETNAPGASFETEAYLLWDERRLLVGLRCQDPDLTEGDEVEILIGTQGDKEPFRLQIGPFGKSHREGAVAAAVAYGSINDRGDIDRFYTVEAEIPFLSLGEEGFSLRRDRDVRVCLRRKDESRAWLSEYLYPHGADVARVETYAIIEFSWR